MIIGKVSEVLQDITIRQNNFNIKLNELNSVMNDLSIPKEFKDRINKLNKVL